MHDAPRRPRPERTGGPESPARSPRARGRAALLACLTLLAGCASTGGSSEGDGPLAPVDEGTEITEETVSPLPPEDVAIGTYLTQLSTSISAWMNKTWTARNARDQREQALLEQNLTTRVRKRKTDIVDALESGAPKSRIIAAAALGFAREPDVLGPLLGALYDPEPQVVGNALLGLGVLAAPETPPGQVCELLTDSEVSNVRWSAASCLRRLVEAGARDERIAESARVALTDPEAMVRSQAVLILGLLADADALEPMAGLLYDEVPLVRLSAARALVLVPREVPETTGKVARALAGRMRDLDRSQRERFAAYLSTLSGRNYGLDADLWIDWARKLP